MPAAAKSVAKKVAPIKAAPPLNAVAKISVIHQNVSAGQQSVSAQRIVSIDGKRLRFDVKSDSYDFQSHAKAELWNPVDGKWNSVYAIPYAQMKTPHRLVYLPHMAGVNLSHFEADMSQLQDVALKIVF